MTARLLTLGSDGTPRCELCRAFILKPGLCDQCAKGVVEVWQVLEISPRVMIEPADLLDEQGK